jgi:diguanylate cyclase (GGDEF)-like protein/PAS domain S-box-containing protein
LYWTYQLKNIKQAIVLSILLALLAALAIIIPSFMAQTTQTVATPSTVISAQLDTVTPTDKLTPSQPLLTKEERLWLDNNQPIRVGVDGSFPPYSFLNEHNQPVGIVIDTLELMAKKLDIEFVIDKQSNWRNVVSNLDAKKIDLILTMVKTPQREMNYLFTSPIVYKSLVIINNKDNPTINSREDIAGKTIALVKNYHYVRKILNEFPSVVPFYVDTMREALEAVEAREADATITFFAGANFLQQKYLFSNLEFAAFFERNSANDAIAVNKDQPMLAAIMQKGLDALSTDEKLSINEKWHANISLPSNHQVVIEIALSAGILISLLSLWLLREKRHNRALVSAQVEAEDANRALNSLREKLEIIVSERTVQLKNSENRYRGLVESLQDEYIFYQHNLHGDIQYVSPSITRILGHKALNFRGGYNKYLTNNMNNLAIPELIQRCIKGEHVPPFEIEIMDVQGDYHTFEVLERPMYNEQNECIGCEGIAHDITERKQHQLKLYRLSHFDKLTNLANRYLFTLSLGQAITSATALNQTFALLFLDLTRFKIINDNLGHSAGDKLLQQAAIRLSEQMNSQDILARFGGDKFCILLHEYAAPQAEAMALKLIKLLTEPFEVYEQSFILGCRIGISLFPTNGNDPETLLKQADAALYVAKKRPAGFAFCSEEQAIYNQRRLKLEQGLRLALSKASFDEGFELSTVYQSLNQLPQAELAGFEALIRWQHPELGPISPMEFIPIAEETGLIFELSRWMLTKVCRQLKQWHKAGFDFKRVSVNLSALDLININLAEDVIGLIAAAGAEPRWLKIEITETALMTAPEQSINTLQQLVGNGIQVAIDDFGTGYSSLAYLKSLPATTLKIDQSFIRNIMTSIEDQAVVKAVISMAHSLGKKVTAEGVETQEQQDFLITHNCDLAQGYLFSKPLTAQECVTKYASNNSQNKIVTFKRSLK